MHMRINRHISILEFVTIIVNPDFPVIICLYFICIMFIYVYMHIYTNTYVHMYIYI
jgi:hypothetical protein